MKEWLTYLNTLHSREIDLGLSRVRAVAEKLSLGEFHCPVITVAGTNGKGSVIKFLESIYQAAGYQVAAYTSPHLLHFNERLRIKGESVLDHFFMEAFTFIESHRGQQPLSFFEFTTLAIFYICQKQPLDMVLLEVGLGGRLDAVNIVDPDVAVISNVDIDHTDWLGTDRESIGQEKAGILRRHIPVVCGDPQPPNSVRERARALEAPFYQFEKDFFATENEKTWVWQGPTATYGELPQPVLKIQNAATSIMAVESLQSRVPVVPPALKAGIKNAVLPGRFECLQTPAPLIFDVAHNPQAARYLAEKLKQAVHAGRTFGVVGLLKDKDIAGVLEPMLPCVDQWYVGGLQEETTRGARSEEVSAVLAKHGIALESPESLQRSQAALTKSCYNFDSVTQAFKKALNDRGFEDRLVVFGSFHTVGLVQSYLSEEAKNGS